MNVLLQYVILILMSLRGSLNELQTTVTRKRSEGRPNVMSCPLEAINIQLINANYRQVWSFGFKLQRVGCAEMF